MFNLSAADEAALWVAKSRGGTATKSKVTKEGKGLTLEWDDQSELGDFVNCINENQSARTGVGRWVADGRMRRLAKELNDLADAAEKAGVRQR